MALTTSGSAAERQMRLDAFFADWMTYETGCSIDNEYCDNPVQAWLRASGKSMNYDSGGGCAMAEHTRVLCRQPPPSAHARAGGSDVQKRPKAHVLCALYGME